MLKLNIITIYSYNLTQNNNKFETCFESWHLHTTEPYCMPQAHESFRHMIKSFIGTIAGKQI